MNTMQVGAAASATVTQLYRWSSHIRIAWNGGHRPVQTKVCWNACERERIDAARKHRGTPLLPQQSCAASAIHTLETWVDKPLEHRMRRDDACECLCETGIVMLEEALGPIVLCLFTSCCPGRIGCTIHIFLDAVPLLNYLRTCPGSEMNCQEYVGGHESLWQTFGIRHKSQRRSRVRSNRASKFLISWSCCESKYFEVLLVLSIFCWFDIAYCFFLMLENLYKNKHNDFV